MLRGTRFPSFKTSPEIAYPAVMQDIRFPRPLRNVEGPLHERGMDICNGVARVRAEVFFGDPESPHRGQAVKSVFNLFNRECSLDNLQEVAPEPTTVQEAKKIASPSRCGPAPGFRCSLGLGAEKQPEKRLAKSSGIGWQSASGVTLRKTLGGGR